MTIEAQPDSHGRADWPVSLTPLIGRERESTEVAALLLRPEVRIVTLTGPGGIGKTRLAMEVGGRLGESFPDGVAFAPLGAIREPRLVLATIAQRLGVREAAGVSVQDGLRQTIDDRHVLLIVDNVEHLLGAVPDLLWLVSIAGHLKILATSRAPLQVRGEQEYAVPPLPLPDLGSGSEVATNPAVALFVERSRGIDPDFRLTETSTPVVAEICRRLDGLPLAIELAAARTKVLSPAALLARMDRTLPLLTGGARDLPDRLRTMRHAIAWSYDLLGEDERDLFNRLCVFVGTFTQLEAEEIAGANGQLLDGLAGLVENSLLRQVEREGEPRFAMLETLREFGAEQLDSTGQADQTRARHAEHFLSLAEAAMVRLGGKERTGWLERLESAHGNLRAALSWWIEQGDSHRSLRLAGALWQFWWWRSHLAEGRQWLERALALPGAADHPAALARVLTGIGALAETQGDYAVAGEHHERAVALWQDLGDLRGLAVSLLFRWLVSFNADDQEGMTALSTESLRLFRELDDPWGIAMSLMEQGVMAMRRHDHAEAESVLGDAIGGFQAVGDAWGVAICQGVHGNVATDRGDYEQAAGFLRESLTTLLALNDLWGVATVLPASSRMLGEQGQWERAVRISGAIARLHETMGAPLKVPFRQRYEQTLAESRIRLGEERYAAAWAAGRALTPEQAVEEAVRLEATPTRATSPIDPTTLAAPLSPREREVLRLIAGRTARQIGEELFISESTVRTHIDNILNKVGARNQKELIAFVYERGLI
jgi:non-specific serine/threonine protein kinase